MKAGSNKAGSDGIVASIDMGTNSTRLLVVDTSTGEVLDRLMTITRLGEGVDATGELAEEAIDRTLAVLRSYKGIMDSRGVSKCRAVATSAARDASNRDRLFNGVTDVLGVQPELLSGSEEGRLSFIGATSDLHHLSQSSPCNFPLDVPEGVEYGYSYAGKGYSSNKSGDYASPAGSNSSSGSLYGASPGGVDEEGLLVVDIGGGSTEIIFGNPAYPDLARAVSLDIGCVRLTERCLHNDPPTQAEIAMARQVANESLASARAAIGYGRYGECLIGLAGTVSTIGSLTIQLDVYDREKIHHLAIQRSVIGEWADTLSGETAAARLQHPGMSKGREDIIAGGVIILDEAMSVFGASWCLISESDILDGLVSSLSRK